MDEDFTTYGNYTLKSSKWIKSTNPQFQQKTQKSPSEPSKPNLCEDFNFSETFFQLIPRREREIS